MKLRERGGEIEAMIIRNGKKESNETARVRGGQMK